MTIPPGMFIDPDRSLEAVDDPLAALGHTPQGHYHAVDQMAPLIGRDALFDEFIARSRKVSFRYQDQCSAKYYFDAAMALRDQGGRPDRVVEVGVYLGGASVMFAAGIGPLDHDLDLVDHSSTYLRFTYERLRRTYPESIGRVRLFHGGLPSYVKAVLAQEQARRVFVHHDASHDFTQVVKDLAALYFVRDKVTAIALQDTNLRGRIHYCNFVDAAVYAIFGNGLKYLPIGSVYTEADHEMMKPNRYQGNYFLPGVPEGMVIPLAQNGFRYPHPSMTLDEFL